MEVSLLILFSILFLLLFIEFLALKLSNQIPLGALSSKVWLETAGKRVLPKHEGKEASPAL